MRFPPDLTARVRFAVHHAGFCFLAGDEIKRVLSAVPDEGSARNQALQDFAQICRAKVETTAQLKSARFVPGDRIARNLLRPFAVA